jgi:tetratricopeptide (TPR) repeat protein
MRTVRVFLSSPADVVFERARVDRVVARLNGELAGAARIETIRWETELYKAHTTFQAQIPEASACDIVLAIFKARLGTPMPPDFPTMAGGEPYPSGSAYEVLSALERRQAGAALPDVYVFRAIEPPLVRLDNDRELAEARTQWLNLEHFFKRHFATPQGGFARAYHTYADADDLAAQIEKLLRAWIETHVLRARSFAWPVALNGSPFRGLSAFGAKHASVFFGRGRDVARCVELLCEAAQRSSPFLLIVGASGVGKSSLAGAGLVPRLTTPGVVPGVDIWRVVMMRPMETPEGPVAALSRHLFDGEEDLPPEDRGRPAALPEIAESDYRAPADLAGLFGSADPAIAINPVLRALERVGAAAQQTEGLTRASHVRLLLVVDQLDELYESGLPENERARFARLLWALTGSGRVFVVATLRAHLYERFLADAELLALKTRGAAYDLASPGPSELSDIVRRPAEAAGLVFERNAKGESLDDRVLADAGGQADMLPLVQLALDRLFDNRVERDGVASLTFAAYDELPGLAGIIDREAERALTTLAPEDIAALPQVVRKLAVAGENGLSIRSMPLADVAADAATRRLVDALVAARILVVGGEGEGTVVQFAHRRIITDWSRARTIAAENADFFRVRGEVEARCRRWIEAGRPHDLLIPRGRQIVQAEEFLQRFRKDVPAPMQEFITRSAARARRTQRLLQVAAASFAILAIGAAAAAKLALDQRTAAERNLSVAKETMDGLTFDIGHTLRSLEGMRLVTLRGLLERVRAASDGLASADAPGLMRSRMLMLNELVDTYIAGGDLRAAGTAAEESLAIARKLAGGGNEPQRQSDLAAALERVADVKFAAGDKVGALANYEKDREITEALARREPNNAASQRDLSVCLNRIGDVKFAMNDRAGALAAFEAALAIRTALTTLDPNDPERRRDKSISLERIGNVKLAAHERGEALARYQEVLGIREALAAEQPGNGEWSHDVTVAQEKIGDAKFAGGDWEGALASYQQALARRRQLALVDPGNMAWQTELVVILRKYADTTDDLSRKRESLEEALRVLAPLEARDALTAAQKPWPAVIRRELASLSDAPAQPHK